jgi:hypothetical protein
VTSQGNYMKARRILFVIFVAAAGPPISPVQADPRDDVLSGAARCNGIADDRTFLDCYYGAAQPLRAQLGLPPAPGSQQILVPAVRPSAPTASARPYAPAPSAGPVNAAPAYAAPAERPGFWSRLFTHTEMKAEPPTRMTSYKFEGGGLFVVTLANGETWKQSLGDTATAKWRGRPDSYAVTILPGTNFGTNRMKVGTKEMYEVERVQ